MDARPWTAAALIGALWGALELSLGTALHLSRIPLRGLVMTTIGLICLVTLRRLRGRFGVCLLAGVTAAFLKIFTLGGFYPGPLIGILLEALVVEMSFGILGNCRFGAVVGSALSMALNPIQMVLMTWVISGRETLAAGLRALAGGFGFAGLSQITPGLALSAVVGSCFALGCGVGWWAWNVAARVGERVAR